MGVAGGDNLVAVHQHGAIRAFHLAARLDDGLDEGGLLGAGNEVDDDFAVGGGLEDGAVFFDALAQHAGVHQVAVVGHGHGAAGIVRHEGLHVLQVAGAEGGIAHVADAAAALDPGELVRLEDVGHEPDAAMRGEGAIVGAADARAFLAAVLQRIEAEVDEIGRFRVSIHAEDAAFMLDEIVVLFL